MEEERHDFREKQEIVWRKATGGLRIVPKINLALIPC
jgi:hypothetical protein